jgi:hypothetical protein
MNLMKIVSEISLMRPHAEATNVIAIDDPELFKYPVAFMVEAGYLTLSDKEVLALRKYLLRGGFLIIDDTREDAFRGQSGWANMVSMLQVVLPDSIRSIWTCPPDLPRFSTSSFDIVRRYYDQGRRSFAESSRQQPEEAAPRHDQLQHRHLELLGILGVRLHADGGVERGLRARGSTTVLCPDSLTRIPGTVSAASLSSTARSPARR